MNEGVLSGRARPARLAGASPRRRSSPATSCWPSTSARGCTSATCPRPGSVEIIRLGQGAGRRRHRRGDPAPPAAHRRAGRALRPGLQGEPAAAHRRPTSTALRAGLADGTIDVVATDHAPHPVEDKDCEWAAAAFGHGRAWRPRSAWWPRRWSRPGCSTGPASPTGCRCARPGSAGSPATAARSRSGEPANLVLVDPAGALGRSTRPAGLAAAATPRTPGASCPGGWWPPSCAAGPPCSTGGWHDPDAAVRGHRAAASLLGRGSGWRRGWRNRRPPAGRPARAAGRADRRSGRRSSTTVEGRLRGHRPQRRTGWTASSCTASACAAARTSRSRAPGVLLDREGAPDVFVPAEPARRRPARPRASPGRSSRTDGLVVRDLAARATGVLDTGFRPRYAADRRRRGGRRRARCSRREGVMTGRRRRRCSSSRTAARSAGEAYGARRRDLRRGRLLHRHDRLPGDAHRPVVPPAGRRA